MRSLAELFENTLQDVYCAENSITKSLPKVVKAANSKLTNLALCRL